MELHLYAGRPRAALQLLMQRLSDALPGSLTNAAKGAPCPTSPEQERTGNAIRILTQYPDIEHFR